MGLCIRTVKQCDIGELAQLYIDVYKKVNPIEKWELSSVKKYLDYFYRLCPDMFYVAETNEAEIVACIWGAIKPWWNGNKVYDLELCVAENYQGHGLSKIMFKHYFKYAVEKYSAVSVEAITFNDRKFPLNYYERIALKKDRQLVLLEGTISEILEKLD